ncbi:MAG: type II toxin-antitoxin system RelE/ParE family toxin [Acidobacteria bacterium]|nr:type II toxin-antitoxin system RelE/ParE family toxin [Acidobacteriota bacterium]
MRHRVIISTRAVREIDAAEQWWRRNRHKAPNAFGEEIQRAIGLLRDEPGVGVQVKSKRLVGVQRIWLKRIRYHLYYRLDDRSRVELLALWHTSRGRKPSL